MFCKMRMRKKKQGNERIEACREFLLGGKEEINKLKLYSTKLKYQKENLEYKLDNEINNEKAKIKELDDLDKKILTPILIGMLY